MRRYQLYNRLVDICFWLALAWLCWLVLSRVFPALHGALQPVRIGLRVLFNFNVLFAIFLVLARFMRDEYAERIWQMTARRFVNFFMVFPLLLSLLTAAFSKQVSAAVPNLFPARFLAILAREPQPSVLFASGIAVTSLVLAIFVPQLFIVLYRWNLWRDSR